MRAHADHQLEDRKRRDRLLVTVLVGAVLVMPPLATLSLLDARLFGIPAPVIYLFSVWIGVIAIGRALSANIHVVKPLPEASDPPRPRERSEG